MASKKQAAVIAAAAQAAASGAAPSTAPAEVVNNANRSNKGAGMTCTVGCKIPNGLILQLYRMVEGVEPSPQGARPVQVGQKYGEPVKLNGFSQPLTGIPVSHQIIGGFGLTHGVSVEFMERWLEQNKDLDMVKNGLVFFTENRSEAEAEARDKRMIPSHMGPLSEKRGANGQYIDPRMPKQIKKVTTEDEDVAA